MHLWINEHQVFKKYICNGIRPTCNAYVANIILFLFKVSQTKDHKNAAVKTNRKLSYSARPTCLIISTNYRNNNFQHRRSQSRTYLFISIRSYGIIALKLWYGVLCSDENTSALMYFEHYFVFLLQFWLTFVDFYWVLFAFYFSFTET